MLGILRDFVKTILMEIFGVKTEDLNVYLKTDVETLGFGFEEIPVLDETVDVEVEGFHGFDDLEVMSGSFDETSVDVVCESLKSSNLEILNIVDDIDLEVFDGDLKARIDVEGAKFSIDPPEVSTLKTPVVITRSELSLSELWRITLRSKSVVEREKVLSALENFLKRYRGNVKDLRFMGYFEGVPANGVESITFRGSEMVIKLKPGTVVKERVDVVAFKIDGTVKLEVI